MRGRGQSKKTWEECNKKDLRDRGLKKEWALDRDRWKGLILVMVIKVSFNNMKRLTRAERSMVRLMCCVGWNGGNTEEFYKRLNIVEISEMVSRERLKWFGHVMRSSKDEWISRCRNFECDGVRGRRQGKDMERV